MSAVVERLSTAAPRKVQQPWTRGRLAARERLPQFPRNHHRTPAERKALKRAMLIRQVEQSAALVIATALFRQLDEMAQLEVIASCGNTAAKSGKLEAVRAVEWLDVCRKGRTYGDNAMLEWALGELEQEGAE